MPTDWRATLYERFRRELFLTAWTVVRRADLAEDAVHQAFTRLIRMKRPPDEPKLYVFRAVRNAAIDLLKSSERRREEPMLDIDVPDVSLPDVNGRSPEAEISGTVREALARLDEPSRTVIEMHLQAGLTFQETADVLGEPLPTVASRYRRALEKLGKEIQVHHD
jgi:RNA polymerase sigma-70 factor (ECF subfamily)